MDVNGILYTIYRQFPLINEILLAFYNPVGLLCSPVVVLNGDHDKKCYFGKSVLRRSSDQSLVLRPRHGRPVLAGAPVHALGAHDHGAHWGCVRAAEEVPEKKYPSGHLHFPVPTSEGLDFYLKASRYLSCVKK